MERTGMKKEGNSDVVVVLAFIVASILFLTFVGWVLFDFFTYEELKGVFKQCDKDFGEGNWTFTQGSDYWSCHNYRQQSFISTSVSTITTKICLENGKEVNCTNEKD
jgi:hypothetical protein